MDCKNAQSAIDTPAMPNTGELGNAEFRAHLDLCNDCQLYSGERAALLGLLAAQPVIEAPADFDIRLRARLARAEGAITIKADNAALSSLLGAQPVISAPADFDFKLRARLAREKARPRSFVIGWGAWGQAVAATATLAVVVTVSALHFANSGRETHSVSPQVNRHIDEKIAQNTEANATAPLADKPTIARKIRYRNTGYISVATDERAKSLPAGAELQNAVDHALNNSVNNAVIDEIWRGFDPEKGEIITSRNHDLIGAEKSATKISKTLSYVPSI